MSKKTDFRKAIIQRDGACIDCGRNDKLHMHHIVPVRNGGEDTFDNVITLCQICHAKKHPDVPIELFTTEATWDSEIGAYNASSLAKRIGCHPRTVKRNARRLGVGIPGFYWAFSEEEAEILERKILSRGK